MADLWLSLIGLGEDGLNGLSCASRDALERAEVIFGGPRHLDLVGAGIRGQAWPVPFSIDPVLACRGREVVVLASGDPFWHGAGGSLMAALSDTEWRSFPAPSTFALAANRLGWRLESTLCLGLHAAPFDRLLPLLGRNRRLVVLLRDGAAPAELAAWLCEQGFGESALHVLECLGGARERVRSAMAQDFALGDISAPVAVAIDCAGSKGMAQASGLADTLFASDGQITKRPVRALTLSALAPRIGEHLWDIGSGSGSIAMEWMLAAPESTASAIEPRADRCANIATNAERFGLSYRLELRTGSAPEALHDLSRPDAVFIGGGASEAVLRHLWDTLPEGTRIVANAVTLESEALFLDWHGIHGGHLLRVELAEASPLGRMRGWDRARPIVQWSVTR